MGFLNWLRKGGSSPKSAQEEPQDPYGEDIYPGMRVEVSMGDGRLLFAAKMLKLEGNTAELHQYTELLIPEPDEPLRVRIRGYNDRTGKAAYMEGIVALGEKHIWTAEELTVVRVGKDRAFYRLELNLDATVTCFRGINAGEKPCKLVNISVGGACIGSTVRYYEDDKLLLKVQLLEERDLSALMCQVLRVIKKDDGKFEYGCRFVGMNESSEAKISQNIFAIQLKKKR